MITEHDLREAIAECEGNRHPSASTCLKLAAYYTILGRMEESKATGKIAAAEEKNTASAYSFASAPLKYSDSEFSKIIEKKGIEACFPIIDELMGALCVCDTTLYRNIMRKLNEV